MDYVVFDTDCLSISVPADSDFELWSDDACSIEFDEGYTSTSRNYDAEPESMDEYLQVYEYQIEDTLQVNGRTAYTVDDGLTYVDRYLFWIAEDDVVDSDGYKLSAITLYLYSGSLSSSQNIAQTILDSFIIK